MRLNIAAANISLLITSSKFFQVDAYVPPHVNVNVNVNVPRSFILSASTRHCTRSRRSFKCTKHGDTNAFHILTNAHTDAHTHTRLNMGMGGKDDIEGKSIEELYGIAMEEDEEWYNTFVRDVLGEDNINISLPLDASTRTSSKGNVTIFESDDVPDDVNVNVNVNVNREKEETEVENPNPRRGSKQEKEQSEKTQAQVVSKVNSDNADIPEPKSRGRDQSQAAQSELNIGNDDHDSGNESVISPNTSERDPANPQTSDHDRDRSKAKDDDNDDDALVQYTDMYDNVQRIPMSSLSKLGYTMKDVIKLQAGVLELIIEDEMPMPKDGLPGRWMVEGRDQKEVKILKKRKSAAAASASTSTSNRSDSTRRDGSRKRSSDNEDEDEVEDERMRTRGRGASRDRDRDRDRPRSDRRRRGETKTRRKPLSQRNSRRNDGDGDNNRDSNGRESESNSLWMDIPTFKQYLRREADLRLTILGPDWEDWVKGESDWRLNLFKNWLGVVENGVGDDLFEDISYAPPSERQRDLNLSVRRGRSSAARRRNSSEERGSL